MIRALFIFTLALVLSGCSALNIKRPVADEDLRATKRIGVVSVLGATFHGVSLGTTVFGNQSFSAAVSDWELDSYSTAEVTKLLSGNPTFASVPLERTRYSSDEIKADGAKLLWQLAEQQGFDRLVIVRPGVSDNNPQFKPSYGIFERFFLGVARRCAYVAYVVDVYEMSTRKPIAWEWGGPSPCVPGKDNDLEFKAKLTDYSKSEQAVLRSRIESRISESLRYALEKLNLISRRASAI